MAMAGQSGDVRSERLILPLQLLLLLMLMPKPTTSLMAMAGQSGDARGVMLTLLLLLMLMLKPTIASMATILPTIPDTDTSMANRDARLNLMPHEHNQNIDFFDDIFALTHCPFKSIHTTVCHVSDATI